MHGRPLIGMHIMSDLHIINVINPIFILSIMN